MNLAVTRRRFNTGVGAAMMVALFPRVPTVVAEADGDYEQVVAPSPRNAIASRDYTTLTYRISAYAEWWQYGYEFEDAASAGAFYKIVTTEWPQHAPVPPFGRKEMPAPFTKLLTWSVGEGARA